MTNLANVAAQIHANMCDDSGFGYSWGERYGTWDDPVTWNIDGRDYTVARGDYDCSSSVCTAWQTALQGTPYEGVLDDATYTGNMRSVFVNSGLFDVWDVNSTSAVRGDVYLNDSSHTAMCQDGGMDNVYGYDALSEFCINEFGETYGGQRGDQTGGESRIVGYYDYPWDCTLHYNGKANTDDTETEPIQAQDTSDRLHIIDIASWQEGIIPSQTNADAVIIKVTGGTHYENPYWRQWADDVLASGKCLGFYHYAVESEGNPQAKAEAEFFLSKIKDYAGKFIPILDWEADALNLPSSWAREWLDIVSEQTGATPWFYGYASNINNTNYSIISEKYPLWMASYLDRYSGGGFENNPEQLWGYGNWNSIIAYQYTSTGYISGYDNNLDLSVGYLSVQDWKDMCGGGYSIQPQPSQVSSKNQPNYAVYVDGYGWLPEMEGLEETNGGSDDYAGIIGSNCNYIGINGVGDYRVYTQANGWLPYVNYFDYNNEEYGMAGDGSPILAIEIPNSNIKYQVHVVGGEWYSWMIGNKDTGGSDDTYAGDMSTPIDGVRIVLI